MKETIIKVQISNIKVDEEYFSFDYKIFVNGIEYMDDSYDSDYSNGMTKKEWKEYLDGGYAVSLALENCGEIEINK